jgi:hypothetical protein
MACPIEQQAGDSGAEIYITNSTIFSISLRPRHNRRLRIRNR